MRFLSFLHAVHKRAVFPSSHIPLLPLFYLIPLFIFILRPFGKLNPVISKRRGLFSRAGPFFGDHFPGDEFTEPGVLGLRVDQDVAEGGGILVLEGQVELGIVLLAFLVHVGGGLRENPALPDQLVPLLLDPEGGRPAIDGL